MTNVLLVRESDSPGYTHFILADPVGKSQAGAYVTVYLEDDEIYTINVHGQREFDVPNKIVRVEFPDGVTWSPDDN